jgi:hypothetical protein
MRARAVRVLIAASVAIGFAIAAAPVAAQTWPDKPIKFVVSAPAGSSLDALARVIGDKLKDRLGQSVIVENKPAAGGTVATAEVAKSAPDGYTMLLGFNGPLAFGPLLQKLPYDVAKDLGAGDHHLEPAQRARSLVRSAGEERPGARELREGESRQAFVRVGRQRQLVASQHGAPEIGCGIRSRARSVQRLAARGDGNDPGRDAGDVRGDAAAAGPDPGRQAARARGDDGKRFPLLPDLPTIAESGYPGLRGARVERRDGAGGDAEARHRQAQRRDERDPEAAGRRRENARFGFDLIGGTPRISAT